MLNKRQPAAISPDGQYVAVAQADTIHLFDTAVANDDTLFERTFQCSFDNPDDIIGLALVGSSIVCASVSHHIQIFNRRTTAGKPTLRKAAAKTGKRDGTVKEYAAQLSSPGSVTSIACCESEDIIFSGCSDGKVRLWDVSFQSPKKKLSGERSSLAALLCPWPWRVGVLAGR